LLLALASDKNQWALRHSSRGLPLKESLKALSVGLPAVLRLQILQPLDLLALQAAELLAWLRDIVGLISIRRAICCRSSDPHSRR
jgi:hypothetical protein